MYFSLIDIFYHYHRLPVCLSLSVVVGPCFSFVDASSVPTKRTSSLLYSPFMMLQILSSRCCMSIYLFYLYLLLRVFYFLFISILRASFLIILIFFFFKIKYLNIYFIDISYDYPTAIIETKVLLSGVIFLNSIHVIRLYTLT